MSSTTNENNSQLIGGPKILLVTPPMTQLNTPYPATAYLTGFLRKHGYRVTQADPAIELLLRLLSVPGLRELYDHIKRIGPCRKSAFVDSFIDHFDGYIATVDVVIRFLQGKDSSLAMRIATREFLPEGPSFLALQQWAQIDDEELHWAFGALGVQDKAKYFASLYLDDLAQAISDGSDLRFSLSRYGERLAASVASFDPLVEALEGPPTLVDRHLDDMTQELIDREKPDVLGLSIPFPGNLLGGLRIAKVAKSMLPQLKVLMGGGYVNTELRDLKEPRLFHYVDYVTLDDGERPLLNILEEISGKRVRQDLFRTFVKQDEKVEFISNDNDNDVPHNDTGIPTYQGLNTDAYLSLSEMLNPMHRIWSDGRWNKLTLAHGCYWSRCSFCDISLDYIKRYQEADIDTLVERIKALIEETGQTGFHFVDEACPPKILFALARRLIEEKIIISWWGNIRFEKSFSPKMTDLLAQSGCIAVTGGLEVASNRLLKLMNKGVTVEQVARVTQAFSDSGILVHAYLMYGFPSQTEQETIDSLERVRQLFLNGCIHSAYWHRFAATVHSPVGIDPDRFNVKIIERSPDDFSKNDLDYQDPVVCDHDLLGKGLKKALYNYMLGIGLEEPLQFWFDKTVPKPKLSKKWCVEQLR